MVDISTQEPSRIQAGDTISWSKTLSDYQASDGWTLHYRIINSAAHYDVTASASGSDHLVTITASTSSAFAPGSYTLVGYVSKSSQRYSISSTKIEVLPDLAAQSAGYDTRSTAKKILDLIDQAMLSHGARAWTQEYEINGRRMRFRSAVEFMQYRSKIQQEVVREENAERIRAGLGTKNRILVRF